MTAAPGHPAISEVLRIAAHDNNLLRRETFEAVAKVLARHIPLDCLAVVVPEPGGKRLYAASLADGDRQLPPFGARFPHGPREESVLSRGVVKLCDDTRNEETLDQIAVHWGFLSYAIVPIHRRAWSLAMAGRADVPTMPRSDAIVGKLIAAFRETGFASRAPLDLLWLVADLLGETFDRSNALTRERRLAMILETSGDAMLAWDEDGRITDANLAAALLVGVDQHQLLGTQVSSILDLSQLQDRKATCAMRTRLAPLSDPGGVGKIPVSVTMTSVEDDPLVATHALIRDESQVVLTEREAALHFARVRELEKELRTLLDNAPLIIFRLDPTGTELKFLNRHAERTLGVPTAEAMRTPGFLRILHRDVDALRAFDAAIAHARAGEVSPPYEAHLRWQNEQAVAVRGMIYPLRGADGDVVAIEGILADVSAEHAARSRAIQADRLSLLGMLAASVAHEINNPASFILLGLGAMDRLLANIGHDETAPEVAREMLSELSDSTNRIVRIARDLRLFARPTPEAEASTQLTDVNEIIESAVSLARGRVIERASLVKELSGVPPVPMDGGRLGQVVLNLLVNAADAIPRESATSTITVASRRAGDHVQIVVSDTGTGISEENLDRIWAPFFSTKSQSGGTGLGLSISRDIVTRAGGTIEVESPAIETGDGRHGSRFVVTIPSTYETPAPTSSVRRQDDDGQPGTPDVAVGYPRRVLIVEDEEPLARALSEELGRHHEVMVANGGARALELLAERRFDVVLCDLRMPGLSGEAVYARVCDRDPEQASAFIFMSGIGFVPEVERFLATSGRRILQKPFEPRRVLEIIAQSKLPRFSEVEGSRA